jgi:hypothetical protein
VNEKDSDDTIAANPETVEVTVATELGRFEIAVGSFILLGLAFIRH